MLLMALAEPTATKGEITIQKKTNLSFYNLGIGIVWCLRGPKAAELSDCENQSEVVATKNPGQWLGFFVGGLAIETTLTTN